MAAGGQVQEIKLRTDLVDLISAYVPLKRTGRTHSGLCPFHSEKTPSFVVDGERGFWRCYGCGKGGDCFAFLQEKEGLSFPEAGERLARRLGIEWERSHDAAEKRSQRERLYDVLTLASRYFQERLARDSGVRSYLARRGLLPETVQAFGLGYAPDEYEGLLRWLRGQKISLEEAEEADLIVRTESGIRDRFVNRVVFPILDLEGRPVGFGGRTLRADGIPKYLNSRETPVFNKGRILYGLHAAKAAIPQAGFAVAVEGYMDLIALHQAGITNSVATLGTALTETHVGILSRYSRELVMCYDGDGAGMRAAVRNSAMFEQAGCRVRVASLPEGEDPDTFLQTQGADSFRSLLNRAEPLLDYQLNMLRQKYNLADPAVRLPFIREAVQVICGSADLLSRQEYGARLERSLERLAEEWYPGEPHRALEARSVLIQEVRRALGSNAAGATSQRFGRNPAGGSARYPARGRNEARPGHSGAGGRPRVGVSPTGGRSGGYRTPEARAEQYVLRAVLAEAYWAHWVAERLGPEHFSEPELRSLAEAVLPGEPQEAAERAQGILQDTANAGLVSRLLLEDLPLTAEGLGGCAELLERAHRARRLRELQAEQLAGKLSAVDPRAGELRALLAELGGSQRRED